MKAMGESAKADYRAERALQQVEDALGGDVMETEAFIQTLDELPEMGELTDELGRHESWVSVAVDYYAAD